MTKFNSRSLLWALLLTAALLASAIAQETTGIDAIRQALLSNETERALVLADSAAQANQNDAQILGLQALAAERNNFIAKATILAEKALKAMPGQLEASLALAEIALGKGQFDSAISHGTAAAKGTFKGDALMVIADAQQLNGNAAAAAQALKEALPHITHLEEVQQKNTKVLADYFAQLGDTTLFQFSGSGVSKIPAKVTQTRMIIPIKVNGAEAEEFVIDTGNAGHFSVTNELAEKLGLKKMGVQTARGADSRFEVWLSIIDSISIGGFTIKNVPVVVMNTLRGTRIGNIGRNILMRFNTAIDYANSAVYFASPGSDPVAGMKENLKEKMHLPFLYRRMMMVNAGVDDHDPTSFIFDTGAPIFVIDESYSKEIGFKPVKGSRPIVGSGAGGRSITIIPIQIKELHLGDSIWQPTRAMAMDMNDLQNFQTAPFHGVVGVDIFQSGILEFNMDSDEIIFYEPDSANNKPSN